MTFQGQRVLAVVPARGGSKGIPRKNLARVAGRSLIARAADVVARLDWVDLALLSTDDEEMAAEGRAHGLVAPFLRPRELARDDTPAAPMWRHAWLKAERLARHRFDVSVLVEPTCPLRMPEDVTRTVAALCAGDHDAAATISRTPSQFTPHKTVVLGDDGVLVPFLGPEDSPTLRQRIPLQYNRNGACYATRRSTVVDHVRVAHSDCVGVVVDRPLVNIDEPFDLEIAEWLWERQQRLDGGSP